MLATSTTLPMEMLLAAESAAQHQQKTRQPQIQITTYAIDSHPVKTQTGLTLVADKTISDSSKIDLLYLPGLWRNPRPTIQKNVAVTEWLKQLHQTGTLISAVGTSV